jgi:hypothetical protein
VKAVLGGIAVPSVGAMPALPDNSTIFHVPLLWNHATGDLFAEATDHSLFASYDDKALISGRNVQEESSRRASAADRWQWIRQKRVRRANR